MKIEIRGHVFALHPDKVLIWPAEKLLIVADIHLGKAQTFLKNGLWLPPEAHVSDLNNLLAICKEQNIQHVLFLGDFIHSIEGVTHEVIQEFVAWKKSFVGRVSVVIGNHDRPFVSKWPVPWSFVQLIDSVKIGDFIFQHEPPLEPDERDFVWCGHIHPKIKLSKGPEQISLPAFVIESNLGYLPAYTSLAAGMLFKGRKGSRYFVTSHNQVIEVKY